MPRKRERRPQQLALPERRTHGGRRAGAGRKRSPTSGVPHVRREEVSERHPVHVTIRVRPIVRSLRYGRPFAIVTAAFAAGCEREGFGLVEWSVQGLHLHLVCEARDRRALSAGIKGL